jgi:hypothetical protein
MTTDDGSAPSWESLSRHCAELDYDDRQKFLGELSEDDRAELMQATPPETLAKWVEEEKEDFLKHTEGQPVEGAEFSTDPGEVVKIDGNDEPEDRAPDEDPSVIEELVKEKLALMQKLTEAHAELDAYYQRFGPLT